MYLRFCVTMCLWFYRLHIMLVALHQKWSRSPDKKQVFNRRVADDGSVICKLVSALALEEVGGVEKKSTSMQNSVRKGEVGVKNSVFLSPRTF